MIHEGAITPRLPDSRPEGAHSGFRGDGKCVEYPSVADPLPHAVRGHLQRGATDEHVL
jgi:hypothetical protein